MLANPREPLLDLRLLASLQTIGNNVQRNGPILGGQRSFLYDTNTITIPGVNYSSFSTYGAGRLVAIQNASFSTMYGTTQGTL